MTPESTHSILETAHREARAMVHENRWNWDYLSPKAQEFIVAAYIRGASGAIVASTNIVKPLCVRQA